MVHQHGHHGHHGELPPSTLAAQLVENISHSSRSSSRPDEISELKHFSTIIDQVKENPEILETAEQRLSHNHMLIYVCGCVIFEPSKWGDPFANYNELREQALKAIQLMHGAIRETPTVLAFVTDGKAFVCRGKEPLWLWILPKVLQLLGRSKCLALSDAIESLFQYIILVAANKSSLWELGASLGQYLRASLAGMFAGLSDWLDRVLTTE